MTDTMNPTSSTLYTATLASFVATLQNERLPENVRERTRYLLLDYLGVALRGSSLPSSDAAYRMLEAMPSAYTNTPGSVTILGREKHAEASWAALIKGVAAHVL